MDGCGIFFEKIACCGHKTFLFQLKNTNLAIQLWFYSSVQKHSRSAHELQNKSSPWCGICSYTTISLPILPVFWLVRQPLSLLPDSPQCWPPELALQPCKSPGLFCLCLRHPSHLKSPSLVSLQEVFTALLKEMFVLLSLQTHGSYLGSLAAWRVDSGIRQPDFNSSHTIYWLMTMDRLSVKLW